jgi:hypothetical protein
MLALLSFCSLVNVVFGNPIPWDPWQGNPIQCFTIVVAEFCGLIARTAVFARYRKARWRKAMLTILVALVVSYVVGIAIWVLGYLAGIIVFSPVNPLFNASLYPFGTMILLLPEFVGTIIGAIIIRANQKVEWKMALITMTVAMSTSFLVGFFLPGIYVVLYFR